MAKDFCIQEEIDRKADVIVDNFLIAHQWLRFIPRKDVFVDYDIEPRHNGALTGKRTAVQQKGKQRVLLKKWGITCSDLEIEHVKYWVDKLARPLFLFVIDTTSQKGWWMFMQKHILEDLPPTTRDKWRTAKSGRMSIRIPAHQTLDDVVALEKAIDESLRYMARVHKTSIIDAVSATVAKLNSLDPNIEASVQFSSDTGLAYVFKGKSGPIMIGLSFHSKEIDRQHELYVNLIEKGLAVGNSKGEITLHGSPIFESEQFKNFAFLQIAKKTIADIIVTVEDELGAMIAEVRFKNSHVEAGTAEMRFAGSIGNGVASVRGSYVLGAVRQNMSIIIDLSKWISLPVTQLPYFSQILAFTSGTLAGNLIRIFVEHEDERIELGAAPAIKTGSRPFWESMLYLLQFTEHMRAIAKRINVDFKMPKRFKKEDSELLKEILEATNYGSFPAPSFIAETSMNDVEDQLMEHLRSDASEKTGTTTFYQVAKDVLLFGQTIRVPGFSFVTTHVIPKHITVTGKNSLRIKWSGTKDTMVTMTKDASPPPLDE